MPEEHQQGQGARPPELGDQPIESRYMTSMRNIAAALDVVLNRGQDRKTGFVLLVFPFGNNDGRCNYISNGADRADVLKLLEEQARLFRDQI